jgi:hypothetical protein
MKKQNEFSEEKRRPSKSKTLILRDATLNYEQTKRIQIVQEIADSLAQLQPISMGYSGSLANGVVNESSDIDLLLIIPHQQIHALLRESLFCKYFQIFPDAVPVLRNFTTQKIDVIRASGAFAAVRLNCEIYSVNSICRILALSQTRIKIVRKLDDWIPFKTEWVSTDNFGKQHIFTGNFQNFFGSRLLTRDCHRVIEDSIALGPDLDRILSAILIIDTLGIELSINSCWKKIFSIVRKSSQSFQHTDYTVLSNLFYHPPRFIPANIF